MVEYAHFLSLRESPQALKPISSSVCKKRNLAYFLSPSPKPIGSKYRSYVPLPLYESRVHAGFPSPADDYLAAELDLNEHLIKHRDATFYVRAACSSMVGSGIFPGDLLIVDRALTAASGNIIIAVLNGELMVKRLVLRNSRSFLCSDNPDYSEIEVTSDVDFSVWGVVTTVIHCVL